MADIIDMTAKKEKIRQIPINRLKAAFRTINRESIGTDQEYQKIIIEEHKNLKV